MKKTRYLIPLFFLILILAAACGKTDDPGQTNYVEESTGAQSVVDTMTLELRVVQAVENGGLVLGGRNASDVYTANAAKMKILLDGEEADVSALKSGMPVTVTDISMIMESFPAQLGTEGVIRISSEKVRNDYPGLYLKVLEDLWTDDDGLNNDAEYVSVDLSKAPGELWEGEKAAIAWIFASHHQAQALTFSFEELVEEGYVNESELYWKNGILFSIKENNSSASGENTISFNTQKWRSGTGAIMYDGCKASFKKDGSWKPYKVGSFAIA